MPFLSFVLSSILVGCVAAPPPEAKSVPEKSEIYLFDPATVISDSWQHIPLKGETEYSVAIFDHRLAIRAFGRHSASMLIRRVSVDPIRCPTFSWSWSVPTLQQSAVLTDKRREDVAASVFVLFGDPGFLFDPKPVLTIRYVWTNPVARRESVIDNPYLPGVVRSIVLQNDSRPDGTWTSETRNLVADYTRAFGAPPQENVHAVALFTDNDQTGEAVEAYYGSGRVFCAK